jgi:hypothetical protein
MSALRRLGRWLALPRDDRRLLTRAVVSLALVDLGLRLLGFRRMVDRSPTPTAPSAPGPAEIARARRYAAWLAVASRHHVVRARCLHRALALHGWLRRQGMPSELRIGVRKERGALAAHAWVELAGDVIDDRAEAVAAFVPLARADGDASVWAFGGPAAGWGGQATHGR